MRLVDVDDRTLQDIKEGLIDLGDAVSGILSRIGDEKSTARVKVSPSGRIVVGSKGNHDGELQVHGCLAININNVTHDVDIDTANSVRFQGKKQEVGTGVPQTGLYNQGDIIWNNTPVLNGFMGWVCIRTGTPGIWAEFGKIENNPIA